MALLSRFLRKVSTLLLTCSCLCYTCNRRVLPQKTLRDRDAWLQVLNFEYLQLHANVRYQDSHYQNRSARVIFRIHKEQKIWFSVITALGIEIIRGLMTPTSITVLDRAHEKCYIYDYTSLQAHWPCGLSYSLAQALLLGELLGSYSNKDMLHQDDQKVVLQKTNGAWLCTHTINKATRKQEEMRIMDLLTRSYIQADYTQFQLYPQGMLHRRAQIQLFRQHCQAEPVVTLTLSRIRPRWPKQLLKFPFTVPAHYAVERTTSAL